MANFLLATAGRLLSREDVTSFRRRNQLCWRAAGGVSLVAGSQCKHCATKSTNSSSVQSFSADASDLDPGAPRRLLCLAEVTLGNAPPLYLQTVNN